MVAIVPRLLLLPEILAFVWLGLAARVVEIEHRGIRAAFPPQPTARPRQVLSRGAGADPDRKIVGDLLTELATSLTHGLLGSDLICEWIADVLSNIAFTPFYAVAAVLLHARPDQGEGGGGVELHLEPGS